MNKIRDGHVHSHYCPHGSNDGFEEYLENAINKGIKEITFTEHMTMPKDLIIEGVEENFLDTTAPNIDEIEKYIKEVSYYKERYKEKIKINIGLEVDYLEGYEDFTKKMLDTYGKFLDDAILSTHIGVYEDKYYCFDYMESFDALLKKTRNVEKIFNKKYPIEYSNIGLFKEITNEINKRNYEIDYNTAGRRKEFCKETYPSGEFYEIAVRNNVRMVYGSDSHLAKDVGFNFK